MATKRKSYQTKIAAVIKARNPDVVVIPPVKAVRLPGEQPAQNPNTESGHFHRRVWNRSDGVSESRVQVYLPAPVAGAMRLFCARADDGRGIPMSAFMTRAVKDLLEKLGPKGRW